MRILSFVILAIGLHAQSPDLMKPFRVEAGGHPVDVDTGHAAPLFVDLDSDGKQDLLVGQFDGGKLRIYENQGERGAPRFQRHAWFEANKEIASVPTG
jgi:hypothetical protein